MISLPKLMDGSKKYENTPSLIAKSMFYYVQSAGHYYCMPSHYEEHAGYNSFLLLYTLDGKGRLDYCDQNYAVSKGQISFINCLDKYCFSVHEKDIWETVWVHFNGSESRSYFDLIYKNNGTVHDLNNGSNIPKGLEQIIEMLENKDLRLDVLNSNILVNILTELILNDLHSSDQYKIPDSIQRAVTLIESSFNQQMDLDSLSKEVCISKFHLSKLFKRYTGFSPYEYLIKYRLNYAKNLLKNTSIPVNVISVEIGFESVSHFIKIFRQYEDITPLKFRERLKNPD